MKSITVIDYGMGNIYSVRMALESLGVHVIVSNNKDEVEGAKSIILPGVGAFKDAMEALIQLDLVDVLKKKALNGTPFLGICLGMQLLLSSSNEFGLTKGLNLIEGQVEKFPNLSKPSSICRIPQISWNTININRNTLNDKCDIFSSLEDVGEFMYFVHSFYVTTQSETNIYARTEYYGFDYCSAVRKDNIYGVQFHPEKSGPKGLSILKKFVEFS